MLESKSSVISQMSVRFAELESQLSFTEEFVSC